MSKCISCRVGNEIFMETVPEQLNGWGSIDIEINVFSQHKRIINIRWCVIPQPEFQHSLYRVHTVPFEHFFGSDAHAGPSERESPRVRPTLSAEEGNNQLVTRVCQFWVEPRAFRLCLLVHVTVVQHSSTNPPMWWIISPHRTPCRSRRSRPRVSAPSDVL